MRRRKLKTIKKLSKFKLPIFGSFSKKRFFLLSIFSFILVAYACLLVLQSPTSGKVLGEKLASCAGEPTCTTLPGGGEFRGNKNALQRYLNSRKGSYSPGEGAAQPGYGSKSKTATPPANPPYSPGEGAAQPGYGSKASDGEQPVEGLSPAGYFGPLPKEEPKSMRIENLKPLPIKPTDVLKGVLDVAIGMGASATLKPPYQLGELIYKPSSTLMRELRDMWENPVCEGIDCTKSIFDPIKGGL